MCIFRCPLFPIHIKRIFANDRKPNEYIEWHSPILNKTFRIPINKLKSTNDIPLTLNSSPYQISLADIYNRRLYL